jgi:hypothetical protein
MSCLSRRRVNLAQGWLFQQHMGACWQWVRPAAEASNSYTMVLCRRRAQALQRYQWLLLLLLKWAQIYLPPAWPFVCLMCVQMGDHMAR